MQLSRMGFMNYFVLCSLPFLAAITLFTAACCLVISAAVGLQIYTGNPWNKILADVIMLAAYGGISWWSYSNLKFCVQRLRSEAC